MRWAKPVTGYVGLSKGEVAVAAAAAALERLSPRGRELLVASEAATDHVNDQTAARHLSQMVNDSQSIVVEAHLRWLRLVADTLVRSHLNAVRSFAQALLEREVLGAEEIDAIWRTSRCHCHHLAPPTR